MSNCEIKKAFDQAAESFVSLTNACNALTNNLDELDLFVMFSEYDKLELTDSLDYYLDIEQYRFCQVIKDCIHRLN